MGIYSGYRLRNPDIKKIMDIVSGHDHDGTNSKAVSVGTVTDGTVTDAKLATAVKVGAVTSLITTSKTNVVGAINELDAELGVLTDLDTTEQGTFVGAINEVNTNADAAVVTANAAASVAVAADAAADAATSAVSAKASLTGAETLTNKTLTAPVVTAPDLTFSASAHNYDGVADWTLSDGEEKTFFLTPTNASGAVNIIGAATANKVFCIVNGTGQALTIKASGQTGITIASGNTAFVRGTGTDYARLTEDAS